MSFQDAPGTSPGTPAAREGDGPWLHRVCERRIGGGHLFLGSDRTLCIACGATNMFAVPRRTDDEAASGANQ